MLENVKNRSRSWSSRNCMKFEQDDETGYPVLFHENTLVRQ